MAAEIIPNFAEHIPNVFEPVVSSSIVLGTVAALLLNGLFRIGQRQRAALALEPAADDAHHQVDQLFYAAARAWGGRPDGMVRVAFGLHQAIEPIPEHSYPPGRVV